MRTVPASLADLIPLEARDGVASVVDELVVIAPASGQDVKTWLWALSIWNARQIVYHEEMIANLKESVSDLKESVSDLKEIVHRLQNSSLYEDG